MRRILVLGGNGQVGFELQRTLSVLGEIKAPGRTELDLADADAVTHHVQALAPDMIVNAAAYTAVDKAEEEPQLARRLNAELPAQLAKYANDRQIPLVHYSSDYVYPGDGSEAWQEGAETGPSSVYGSTKLAGDQAVQASGCQHLILRTSWVYSARGHNFMKTMLRLARERSALRIVNDQIGAPTPARLIADVTLMALHGLQQGRVDGGLYHLAPRGTTSWHGFAGEIFRLAREAGEPLAVDPSQVAGIPTSEYPTPAVRPLNSRLDVSRIEWALGVCMPDWRSQLALTLGERLEYSQLPGQ
ncbi:dTDP-4-dehydrorhamnose reductase [Halomonas sp. 18H]|uniref:dTDP-4-dehydrorhamnose reductase n=1 Tax=Halomonas almeriensis TaxID=308163 RepID=UPI0022310452|nr:MULTISPECIES: dTDP-4-dehydrorhamnose reductase [Halomonas]MCW4151723.1 dTDP-4-dehydrorhamnose reductase [Halomonas sp. 18H]MDN3553968.1 dTDP-4-dehydrorhamnose reductase [Halomonas almeriensis]